jgi:hypothetical protein
MTVLKREGGREKAGRMPGLPLQMAGTAPATVGGHYKKTAGYEVGGRYIGPKRPQGSADSALRYRWCSD